MEDVIISIGSNLGSREYFLDNSIKLLSRKLKFITSSSTYETEGYGVDNHPNYLNKIIYFKTNLSFISLLNHTKKIEKKLGRYNKNDLTPRVIDIDIIFFGDKRVYRKNLVLPHKQFQDRSFVIIPFYEVDKVQKKILSKKFKKFLKRYRDLNYFLRDII
ncbi:MAG: 2-amino-4-hydroxy-6-hydroxymethyldihydropteridine diphosphokinase [Chloroflexi bacterium]|nr:2-amino-4-hydroxy-6-hydroxymethyldihydropteridine diphosphokinase [Chloroflexota bacterium]|tara:strand:+ start:2275 stop:2754 length:480 start_codon:yes stop_codon:yes gene_type:complete